MSLTQSHRLLQTGQMGLRALEFLDGSGSCQTLFNQDMFGVKTVYVYSFC